VLTRDFNLTTMCASLIDGAIGAVICWLRRPTWKKPPPNFEQRTFLCTMEWSSERPILSEVTIYLRSNRSQAN